MSVTLDYEQPVDILLLDLMHSIHFNRPWSLCRCGDSEWIALTHDTEAYDKWFVEEGGKLYFSRWGYVWVEKGSYEECRVLLAEAYRDADWFGVIARSPWSRVGAIRAFETWGIPEPRNQVYAWANLYLPMYREFMELLLSESLFLVGDWMPKFVDKLREAGHTGTIIQGSIPCCKSLSDFQQLCKEVEDFPGRLVLASLSLWAKPLCNHAKKCGKIGIDFGNAAVHLGTGSYQVNTCCGYGRRGYLEHMNHATGPPMFLQKDLWSRTPLLGGEES